MKIEWTVTYECEFNLEQAIKDFYTERETNPDPDIEVDIDYAMEENLSSSERIPEEVYEKAKIAFKHAIGGIQLEMNLDNL